MFLVYTWYYISVCDSKYIRYVIMDNWVGPDSFLFFSEGTVHPITPQVMFTKHTMD